MAQPLSKQQLKLHLIVAINSSNNERNIPSDYQQQLHQIASDTKLLHMHVHFESDCIQEAVSRGGVQYK